MTWQARNRRILALFAPLLVVTGLLGFVLPAHPALMSNATPYNLFHVAAGAVGLSIVALRPRASAWFNGAFGAVDLWLLVAGLTGLFPSTLFALRPADHVVHALVGAGLLFVGVRGVRTLD